MVGRRSAARYLPFEEWNGIKMAAASATIAAAVQVDRLAGRGAGPGEVADVASSPGGPHAGESSPS